MTLVEYRPRSKAAPDGLRIFIGRTESPKALRRMQAQKALCNRLGLRGEWEVLRALAARTITIEQVERLVDEYGIADYRSQLELRPRANLPTLDEHVQRYLDTVRKPGTRNTYRIGLTHLQGWQNGSGRLGSLPWTDVYPHVVQEARDALLRRLADATVATYVASWSAFFDWAISREESEADAAGTEPALSVNPVRKAGAWVKVTPTRQRFLTRDEYQALLDVAPPPMKAQYATLVCTGLRGSEFRHLPPAHVIPDKLIRVAPWAGWVPKGYPRSNRGVRDVPVHHTALRPLLEEYAAEYAGTETFFVNPLKGEPWTEFAFRYRFYLDVKAAGLVAKSRKDGEPVPGGVTPHTTRHTFASWLAQADVQLLKIAELMGDTEDTVRRYYAHLLPSDLDRTVQRLFGEDA